MSKLTFQPLTNCGAQCRGGTSHTMVDKTSTITPGWCPHPKSCRTEMISGFSFPTSHRKVAVRSFRRGLWAERSPGLGLRDQCPTMGFLTHKCFFSKFKHARDGKRCVLRSAHRQAKSRGNTNTHSRAPSAFWVPDWAIWDCHFCRSKMIQYPPQQCAQQFYF